MQAILCSARRMRSGAVVYSAFGTAVQSPLARMEIRGSAPYRLHELSGSAAKSWFSRPRNRLHLPTLRPAHIPDDSPRSSFSGGGEPGKTPPSSSAPRRCAPRATATSIRGLRASILASQGSAVSPRRVACWTTVMAPVINSRLRSRWPIFDILPSLGLPPVVVAARARATAEKSRPRRKPSIGGAKWKAIAVIGPIPIRYRFIRRAASSSWRALMRSSFSNPTTFSPRPEICSSRRRPSSRT